MVIDNNQKNFLAEKIIMAKLFGHMKYHDFEITDDGHITFL